MMSYRNRHIRLISLERLFGCAELQSTVPTQDMRTLGGFSKEIVFKAYYYKYVTYITILYQ